MNLTLASYQLSTISSYWQYILVGQFFLTPHRLPIVVFGQDSLLSPDLRGTAYANVMMQLRSQGNFSLLGRTPFLGMWWPRQEVALSWGRAVLRIGLWVLWSHIACKLPQEQWSDMDLFTSSVAVWASKQQGSIHHWLTDWLIKNNWHQLSSFPLKQFHSTGCETL